MADQLSVIQAARALRSLKIQSKEIYSMIKSGEIRAEKRGNCWQVPRSEVERLLSGIDRKKSGVMV
jgi:excisionase family DNA binding protein